MHLRRRGPDLSAQPRAVTGLPARRLQRPVRRLCRLERRSCATVRVPESQYVKYVADDPVVQDVANARQRDAPHSSQLGLACPRAQLRLHPQQLKRVIHVLKHGTRCRGPMLRPPRRRCEDVLLGLVRDVELQGWGHAEWRKRSRKTSHDTT